VIDPSNPYHLSMAADAILKLCRYRNCAPGEEAAEPGVFFSAANTRVEERAACEPSTLGLHHVLRGVSAGVAGIVDCPAPDEEGQRVPCCATNVHAARVDGSKSSVCDSCGTLGCTCPHGLPMPGTFVDMPEPEQFSMYLLIMEEVVKTLPADQPLDVYVDFGCQLWQVGAGLAAWAGALRMRAGQRMRAAGGTAHARCACRRDGMWVPDGWAPADTCPHHLRRRGRPTRRQHRTWWEPLRHGSWSTGCMAQRMRPRAR
jgi:hypothetical protein